MPYIPQEMRDEIDQQIDDLVAICLKSPGMQAKIDGVANYIITRVVLSLLRPSGGWNYAAIADVIKTFECAKLEIYRSLAAPYEAQAMLKNGDVKEYEEFDKELYG